MSYFVDTSVWSLALRRDNTPELAETRELARAIADNSTIYITGLVLQELLQGFHGPKAQEAIVSRFAALPLIVPDRGDHIHASEIRNSCRRKGIQVGTVDALLAQLCIRHELKMLSTDRDFHQIARLHPLKIWALE